MLTITQIIELTQQSTSNVVDFVTGLPIISGPAPEVGEVVLHRTFCLVCGAPFWWAKPVGQRGRYRRFCSDVCWQVRHLQHNREHVRRRRTAGMNDLFDQPTGERDDETNDADA